MFYYHAFGLDISSEIEFPGMMMSSSDRADVEISMGEVGIPLSVDGLNFLVDQEDVYLWWDDVGKVKISKGKKIIVDLESDESKIIPFILGPVMALLLHQRGFLVLHGSAVRIDDGAVAFLGHRGFGKSTTAINLYIRGFPLVADDILAIKFNEEGLPMVYPGYLHVRLSEDSYHNIKDKTNILSHIRTMVGKAFCDASHGFSPEAIRLEGIYIINKGDKMEVSDLNSQKDLLDLIIHSTGNRIFENTDQAKNLIQCANLVNNISIRRLEIKHSFNDISELIKLIKEDLTRH